MKLSRLTFLITIILILPVSERIKAATIVGHGGNAGDVELLVTTKQIQDVMSTLGAEKSEDLCYCWGPLSNHPICESLKSLSDSQQHFCTKFLIQQAGTISTLLKEDKVKFEWTHSSLEVHENGKLRAVDAVANPPENKITLNQDRFLSMSAPDRIFLLTHELLHFTKWNEKPVVDEGTLGTFTGDEGGRAAINAAAAATAVAATTSSSFNRYNSVLKRAKGWKKNWFDVGFVGALPGATSSSFGFKSLAGSQFRYRHYFSDWGIIAAFQNVQGNQNVLGSINSNENNNIFGLGLTYRIFPFSDPLTYLGQTHLSVYGMAQYVQSSYLVNDGYVSNQSNSQTWGAEVGGSCSIPMFLGIWAYLGASYTYHPYQFTTPNFQYGPNTVSAYTGVSYGF